jgi:hypothetical protein
VQWNLEKWNCAAWMEPNADQIDNSGWRNQNGSGHLAHKEVLGLDRFSVRFVLQKRLAEIYDEFDTAVG